METNLDGIVATNTTISRENLKTEAGNLKAIGNGGVSGKPLKNKATEIIRFLRQNLPESIRIIGVGGILDGR